MSGALWLHHINAKNRYTDICFQVYFGFIKYVWSKLKIFAGLTALATTSAKARATFTAVVRATTAAIATTIATATPPTTTVISTVEGS